MRRLHVELWRDLWVGGDDGLLHYRHRIVALPSQELRELALSFLFWPDEPPNPRVLRSLVEQARAEAAA